MRLIVPIGIKPWISQVRRQTSMLIYHIPIAIGNQWVIVGLEEKFVRKFFVSRIFAKTKNSEVTLGIGRDQHIPAAIPLGIVNLHHFTSFER